MFDAVRFVSFKSLADVTLELGRLTLLVGANASGKSSVLDGLHLLCQLGAPGVAKESETPGDRPAHVFSGARSAERLRTWNQTGPLRLEARSGGRVALAVDVDPHAHDRDCYALEFDADEKRERLEPPERADREEAFFEHIDRQGFAKVARLRMDSARVASFAKDSVRPHVEHDGAGTAAVLAWLAEKRSTALDDIERDLATIVPQARRLLPQRATRGGALGRLFSVEMSTGAHIAGDLLSEGTLLTIGLLTVLHRQPAPRLVLLDDFDRALHPKAQRQLVTCVKALLDRNADLQFVCTTHSPYVLDLFDAGDVRVLRADAQGHTVARKLTDHPEWAAWKDTMKAGEFWSYVGEDWLDDAVAGA